MYDVTDAAFRAIIAKYGKPDVFWTEFVSTDGLQSEGREKLMHHLKFSEIEHPIVAQVFGTKPEKYTATAELVKSLGFDGMDINMGCPDKNIIKGGSCAALFRTPELAKDLVLASKAGAGDMPISVKIRIGDTKIDWQGWIGTLLEAKPSAITIHLRTRKEMSKVPAHWELMPEIVKFIHDHTTDDDRPVIIGNGDVLSIEDGKQKAEASGCDGIMIGRGIFGNPWLFSKRADVPTQAEKIALLIEHIQLYDLEFEGKKHFDVMKRHFKNYIHGFAGSAELRAQLYECKNSSEVIELLKNPV